MLLRPTVPKNDLVVLSELNAFLGSLDAEALYGVVTVVCKFFLRSLANRIPTRVRPAHSIGQQSVDRPQAYGQFSRAKTGC